MRQEKLYAWLPQSGRYPPRMIIFETLNYIREHALHRRPALSCHPRARNDERQEKSSAFPDLCSFQTQFNDNCLPGSIRIGPSGIQNTA